MTSEIRTRDPFFFFEQSKEGTYAAPLGQ